MRTKMTKTSIGNCGEYFVAAELERRGFTCALLLSGTEYYDILAINRGTKKQYAIQVKTTLNKKKSWPLREKNERLIDEDLFYVFVSLRKEGLPEYHIVPSKTVADSIKKEHRDWLKKPGKNGQPHKENSMRKFLDENNKYLDNWDCLK